MLSQQLGAICYGLRRSMLPSTSTGVAVIESSTTRCPTTLSLFGLRACMAALLHTIVEGFERYDSKAQPTSCEFDLPCRRMLAKRTRPSRQRESVGSHLRALENPIRFFPWNLL